jgi:hypothetical protein
MSALYDMSRPTVHESPDGERDPLAPAQRVAAGPLSGLAGGHPGYDSVSLPALVSGPPFLSGLQYNLVSWALSSFGVPLDEATAANGGSRVGTNFQSQQGFERVRVTRLQSQVELLNRVPLATRSKSVQTTWVVCIHAARGRRRT